jgi:hypothetical protein
MEDGGKLAQEMRKMRLTCPRLYSAAWVRYSSLPQQGEFMSPMKLSIVRESACGVYRCGNIRLRYAPVKLQCLGVSK